MKSVADALAEVRKWLRAHLADGVASPAPQAAHVFSVALGKPSRSDLATSWEVARGWALEWRREHLPDGCQLEWTDRVLHRTRQEMPTHLRFTSLDSLAAFAAEDWPQRLSATRARWAILVDTFPSTAAAPILRSVSGWTGVDFDLLVTAGTWFSTHDAAGLTPRQVPVEGLHGKWLNQHHALVASLAGRSDLGLTSRPTRIHFTYLDPAYRSTGARAHDSLTLGDSVALPYQPTTVVILENKDTAVLFPMMSGAVAVEGNGNAAPGLVPQIPWIKSASSVIYWGDMDSAGYEIVDRLRTAGLPVRTMLMDQRTYDEYERFGTNTDEYGKPLPCRSRRPCPTLHSEERRVYENLTDPGWPLHRRIEQERIPLSVALAHANAITAIVRCDQT